jgi:hypothetical protein
MRPQKPMHEKIVLFFAYLMAAVYVVLGITLIIWPSDFGLSDEIKIALGITLIIYGVFRGVRAYKQSAN